MTASIAPLAAGTLVAASLAMLLRQARSVAAERSRGLLRSEARYQELVEQVPAVVVLFRLQREAPGLRPVYVSPQSARIIGLTPDEWVANPERFGAHIHADDMLALQMNFAEQMAGRIYVAPEFRFTRPDGEEIWLRDVSGVVSREPDGVFLHSMLVDITEAKRAEAHNARMEKELRLAQKLEAVGQLAAGIAHEINTPIQFVGDTMHFLHDAFTDLLELNTLYEELRRAVDAGAVDPELLARIDAAEETADLEYLRERVPAAFERGDDGVTRVGTIVRAMRDYAHPPTLEKAPLDVVAALGDTLIVAHNAYRYIADVERDFDALPEVIGNAGELSQVFLNLVVNAAHAIESAVGDTGERGTITVGARVEGDHVRVWIADTGCGIPAEIAARVFDPFFTTKEVGRGTGQGLAIARTMVVERHGGSLTFESEPGLGTTFHVRLPIGTARAVVAA